MDGRTISAILISTLPKTKIPFESLSKGILSWLRYQDSNLGRQNQNL